LENINNSSLNILFKDLNNYNWFRFPILLKSEKEKEKLYKIARKNNILFWNTWSWTNLAPLWTSFKKAKYKVWSCPISEDISKRILTLPNHKLITKKDLEKVVNILNNFNK
jgi:dTDP-4-amino-4,6-dideoxygalactose transaminase